MLNIKRFLVVLFLAVPFLAIGQGRELTVEESYLQDTIELMIIREQSRTDSRDSKMVALEFINDAIMRGNRSDEIRATLEFLSLEGVMNMTRENGRVVNNFPDVRREAATQLGLLGTPEAQTTLLRMINVDNEPMVITEAVRSLGVIGTNEADEVTRAIAWTVNRFHFNNPDNFLALSALDAFERIAAANGGVLTDRSAIEVIFRISEGPYIRPVQERARILLNSLRRFE